MVVCGRLSIWLLGIVLALTACSQSVPRFESASQETIPPDRVPIVFVPGISREVARQLNRGIIPFSALGLRTDAEALAHLGDPRFPADGDQPLQVPGALDRALRGTDVRGLQALINYLIQDEGYVRGDPEQPRDKDYPENPESVRADRARSASLFVTYYDWRRDVAESACLLAEHVARIRRLTSATRVHLVGHSLGGVIVRYYLRYGGRDVMRDRDCPLADGEARAALNAPGSDSVDRTVTLGSPYRGSELAFRALLQDFNLFGIVSLGLRRAIFTMPVAWELLPFAGEDGQVPLLLDGNGVESVQLYDPGIWVQRGWLPGDSSNPERQRFVQMMLARARRFHQRMAEWDPAEDTIPRLIIGGGCRPTPARAIVANGKVEFLGRSDDENPLFALTTVPGDGVVSLDSSLGLPPSPTLTPVTVCSGHGTYVSDPGTAARIVRFLLH